MLDTALPLIPDQCIEANPDISGIGVRLSIYLQNFIGPILTFLAFLDQKVEVGELDVVEAASTSVLLTACALLSSAFVQARSLGMSTYHALIILNLAWMNNTNTFVYAIICSYQNTEKGRFFTRLRLRPPRDRILPFLVGSLHLSFVAGFGLWFWTTIDKFGTGAQCELQLPLLYPILGRQILVTSTALRVVSLTLYAIIALPGVNVLVIMWIIGGTANVLFHFIPSTPFLLPGCFWLVMLVGINVIVIADTEIMIRHTKRFVMSGESDWTFGQTLAVILLLLPLRDVIVPSVKAKWKAWQERRAWAKVV